MSGLKEDLRKLRERLSLGRRMKDSDAIHRFRFFTDKQEIQNGADGIYVGIKPLRVAQQHFRRRISGLIESCHFSAVDAAGGAKVDQLNGSVFQKEDIVRADVAMQYFSFVNLLQYIQNFNRKMNTFRNGQRVFRPAFGLYIVFKIPAFQIFLNNIGRIVALYSFMAMDNLRDISELNQPLFLIQKVFFVFFKFLLGLLVVQRKQNRRVIRIAIAFPFQVAFLNANLFSRMQINGNISNAKAPAANGFTHQIFIIQYCSGRTISGIGRNIRNRPIAVRAYLYTFRHFHHAC